MCGITGFCDFKNRSDHFTTKKMADSLIHRGPDAVNTFFQNSNNFSVGLGHRRLSIIDLSERANQPMEFENLIITYNGEVYNFKEIRKELEKFGYSFKSESDTEVVLKAFHHWGTAAINKFNGMFAFCIFDKKNKQLYLVRDRAGVKPLFYYFDGEVFLFGSELKALFANPYFKKELDIDSLGIYLNLGYIPTPYSIFLNTYKLKPGSFLQFDILTKQFTIEEYWRIQDYYNKEKLSVKEDEILENIEKFLTDSLSLRLISDVPIGIFLSGGYDSTLLAAILKKKLNADINAYTMRTSHEDFDESKRSEEIAAHLGLNHQIFTLTEKDAQNILLDFPQIYDEPYGDTSGIPTIFLSQLVRNDGIKVVLTGDGAEETFAGYDIYFLRSQKLDAFIKFPKFLKKLILYYHSQKRFLKNYPKDYFTFIKNYYGLKAKYPSFFQHPLLNQDVKIRESYFDLFEELNDTNSYHDKLLAHDFRTRMMDDFVCKIDRGTMSKSVESREPYLDYRLIEYLALIPNSVKCRSNISKYLLKQLTHRFVLLNIMKKPKKGFAIPIDSWLRGSMKYLVHEFLSEYSLKNLTYINHNYARYLKNSYINNQISDIERANFIYLLLFRMWQIKWDSGL